MRFSIRLILITLLAASCTSLYPNQVPLGREAYPQRDTSHRAAVLPSRAAVRTQFRHSLWVKYADERNYLDSVRSGWNVASLNLSQLLNREVQLSYERFLFRRLSLEGMAGIRIPGNGRRLRGIHGVNVTEPDQSISLYPFARSYNGAIGFKCNIITPSQRPLRPLYLEIVPFWRQNGFRDEVYATVGGGNYSHDQVYLQTAQQEQKGVKLLLGVRLPTVAWEYNRKTFVDVFGGISYRDSRTKLITYGGATGTAKLDEVQLYSEPRTEETHQEYFSLQFGAKFSFAWRR